MNVDVCEGGLQAISSQARILIDLEIVGESICVLFYEVHGLVLIQELRILSLLVGNLHLRDCRFLVLEAILTDVMVLRCPDHSVCLPVSILFLI